MCWVGWMESGGGLVVKLFRLEEWFIVALCGCFDLALPLVLGELVVVLSLVFWCDWFTLLVCFGFSVVWGDLRYSFGGRGCGCGCLLWLWLWRSIAGFAGFPGLVISCLTVGAAR